MVGSLSFNVHGWGVSPNSDPFGQTEKGGEGGGTKIGHFSWMSWSLNNRNIGVWENRGYIFYFNVKKSFTWLVIIKCRW